MRTKKMNIDKDFEDSIESLLKHYTGFKYDKTNACYKVDGSKLSVSIFNPYYLGKYDNDIIRWSESVRDIISILEADSNCTDIKVEFVEEYDFSTFVLHVTRTSEEDN